MEYLLKDSDQTLHLPELSSRTHPLQDLRALWRLWRLMQQYRPDIVHTHTAKAGVIGRVAAILAGIPCVVHTFHGHVLEGYFSPLVNRAIRWIEKALAWRSARICTVSRQQAEELSGRFAVAPADKVEVIPLGLDLQSLLSLPAPDFQSPRWTIGWLGRFVPIKNLQLLIDVATAAANADLPLDFLIAGDGAERSWFESELRRRRLSHVQVLGWQDEVDAVIARCHLLLLTSHREGTPLALIQGMAAGRPFVSTPAGGTVDLALGPARVERRSRWHENSVLVAAEPAQFLEVLRDLLARPKEAALMSEAAREFAHRSFAGERLVSDMAHLYGVLLRETGRIPDSEAALR